MSAGRVRYEMDITRDGDLRVYEIRGAKGGPAPMLLRNAPRDPGYVEPPRRMWQSRFQPKSRQEIARATHVFVRSVSYSGRNCVLKKLEEADCLLEWQVIV